MQKNSDVLLEMKNMSKSFPGVKALDGVSLTVRRGTVHALMGENGAGKSTLMKCLFGINSGFEGEIFLEGNNTFDNVYAVFNTLAVVNRNVRLALCRVHDNGVHRADRTLDLYMGRESRAAVADHTVCEKRYLAVVQGRPEGTEGTFVDLLFKDARANKSYVVQRPRRGVKEASLTWRA